MGYSYYFKPGSRLYDLFHLVLNEILEPKNMTEGDYISLISKAQGYDFHKEERERIKEKHYSIGEELHNTFRERVVSLILECIPFVTREEIERLHKQTSREMHSYDFPYTNITVTLPLGDASFVFAGREYEYEDFYIIFSFGFGNNLEFRVSISIYQSLFGDYDEDEDDVHPHCDYDGGFCMGSNRAHALNVWVEEGDFLSVYVSALHAVNSYQLHDAYRKLDFDKTSFCTLCGVLVEDKSEESICTCGCLGVLCKEHREPCEGCGKPECSTFGVTGISNEDGSTVSGRYCSRCANSLFKLGSLDYLG